MTPEDRPARALEAVTLEFDGATLVYQQRTGEVHRLDSVGSVVWRVLDGETPVGELVQDLAEAFTVDPAVVRADVTELLAKLEQARLLAGAPDAAPRRGPVLLTNPPSP